MKYILYGIVLLGLFLIAIPLFSADTRTAQTVPAQVAPVQALSVQESSAQVDQLYTFMEQKRQRAIERRARTTAGERQFDRICKAIPSLLLCCLCCYISYRHLIPLYIQWMHAKTPAELVQEIQSYGIVPVD